MQGFAHALIPIILGNEVWLPHTPNPRTCWTFFDLQSSLSFPPLFLFFPLPSFCTPGTPKFSALSNCGSTYIHPKCSARKKKDFQFMTIHLFWVFAITHMEKQTHHSLVWLPFVFPSFYCWLIHNFQSEADYLQKGGEGRSWPNNFPAGNRTSSHAFKNCFHFT